MYSVSARKNKIRPYFYQKLFFKIVSKWSKARKAQSLQTGALMAILGCNC